MHCLLSNKPTIELVSIGDRVLCLLSVFPQSDIATLISIEHVCM